MLTVGPRRLLPDGGGFKPRGRLSQLLRSRPLPTACALALGIASVAWALHAGGGAFSGPLVAMLGKAASYEYGPAGSAAQPITSTESNTVAREPQWGDPLPSHRAPTPAQAVESTPPLPPATPRRNAGTVVLASQYFGIAPAETSATTASETAMAALPAVLKAPEPALSASTSAFAGLAAGNPTTEPEAPESRPVTAFKRLATTPTPSSTHLAQLGNWIGLTESLAVGKNPQPGQLEVAALTLPQAFELGRARQSQLVPAKLASRDDARSPQPSQRFTGGKHAAREADLGYQAAEVFLAALDSRMNHALAQRYERQLQRVMVQARSALAGTAQADALRSAEVLKHLRQARQQTQEALAQQERDVKTLTELIGHSPQALSWARSELELPPTLKLALQSAKATQNPQKPSRGGKAAEPASSFDLPGAYARMASVDSRLNGLHEQLLTKAQRAGGLHAQMLQGRKPAIEVMRAYGELHQSRKAVASMAMEDLHTQLRVAQSTGWLARLPARSSASAGEPSPRAEPLQATWVAKVSGRP